MEHGEHGEHGRHASSADPDRSSLPAHSASDADATTHATSRRKHARITTAAAPGSDPNPAPEPPRSSGTENDARLKADKPPHWG
ncbi:MAG: hypothetical protein ACOH1T_07065 [Microbacteriaceae bacterium]